MLGDGKMRYNTHMSGEISPVRKEALVPPPVKRPEIQAPASLMLSADSAKAAVTVARDIASQGVPSSDAIEELSLQVTRDVANSGVALPAGESDRLAGTMAHVLKEKKNPGEPDETVRLPSLSEYFGALKHVEDTYGVGAYKKELNIAGSTFVGLELANAAAQYLYFGLVDRLTEGKNDLEILNDVLGTASKVPGMKKPERNAFLTGTLKKTAPIWAPFLINIAANQTEVFAKKKFDSFISKISGVVNKRITESLFLGEYAFLQDKSPAEVLGIIERGKLATIDLIQTTYGDLLPSLAAMGASTVPSWKINPIATALGVLRLPSLYQFSKRRIETVLKKREDTFEQQSVLETKIASLLSNLEIAKTSGKPDEVARELQKAMEDREKLFSGQRVGTAKKEAKEKLINTLFDQVSPWVVAGLEVFQGWKDANAPLKPVPASKGQGTFQDVMPTWDSATIGGGGKFKEDVFGRSLVNAYAKQWEFKYIQQSNTQLAHHIARLYANNILPDLQDIADMEALLGSWGRLDKPDGPKERGRLPVSKLKNLDISVRNLHVKNILHDVSFDIKQGEFVAIRAQKGEGKTTLLRTLLGLYEPERGSVAIGGIPVDGIKKYGSESLNSKFGYANQNPGFIETMTLKDNLLLWNKEKIPEERVITVMRDLGMEKLIPRLEEKGKYFSGGELRLLGIARALLTDPKVLFLDEPTANLDPATVDRLVTVLQAIRKKFPGTTIITVTHDDDFAKHTDRTIHLSELNKRVPQQLGDHQVLEAVAKAR